MIVLKMTFQTLTPMFLGGADGRAELRAASIKGALRWWYRAVDPDSDRPDRPDDEPPQDRQRGLPIREDLLFGGTENGAGQSRLLLQVAPAEFTHVPWDRDAARRFNTGRGPATRNGLVYLGYVFQLPGNEHRTAVSAGTQFEVRCILPHPPKRPIHRRAILASLWLLGTCGSLGTRSRRGFGSLSLMEMRLLDARGRSEAIAEAWAADLQRLPLASQAPSAEQWSSLARKGMEVCREWLKTHRFDQGTLHPHVGEQFRWKLLDDGFVKPDGWQAALNHAGSLLQGFRQNPEVDAAWRAAFRSGEQPRQTPHRATFGLPLTFRSPRRGSRDQKPPIIVPTGQDFQMDDFERHASLLLIKVVKIGQGLHPLFVRMAGAVPGQFPPGAIRGRGGRGTRLEPAAENLMDQFLQTLERRS